jgi:hypothetical protein
MRDLTQTTGAYQSKFQHLEATFQFNMGPVDYDVTPPVAAGYKLNPPKNNVQAHSHFQAYM